MRLLSTADTDRASEVLARAFYRDPLWMYLLPDATQRAVAVRQAFRTFVPLYIRSQQSYGVGEPLEGVAVWSIPGETRRNATLPALLTANFFTLIFSPLSFAFRRAVPIFGRFSEMQQQYAPEPHVYLNTIGVLPAAQGKGLASQLIKPCLARADRQGQSVYTETMTPANVGLYLHYGFVCREQWRVPGTELSVWAFYRPAQTAARL